MSQSTVIAKIDSLMRRQLIGKRTTVRHSKSGKASTGNNHYYIRSVAESKVAHERFGGCHGEPGGTLTGKGDIQLNHLTFIHDYDKMNA